MIARTEFYNINYFEYGEAFYGSHGKMRFRIARLPLKDVHYDNSSEKNKDALLECEIWKGPLAYARTKEKKQRETFPFNEEGAKALTEWLNSVYETQKHDWE